MGAATSLLALTLQTTTLHSWPTFDPWRPPFKNFSRSEKCLWAEMFSLIIAIIANIMCLPFIFLSQYSRLDQERRFFVKRQIIDQVETQLILWLPTVEGLDHWANSLLSGLNFPWNQLLKLYCTQISQKWSSIHNSMGDLNLLNKDC